MKERNLWWLNPACVVGAFTGFVVIAAHIISTYSYLSNWGTPKFLDGQSLLLMLSCVGCFLSGALLVQARPAYRHSNAGTLALPLDRKLLRQLLIVSYALTLLGYLVWAGAAVGRGLNLGTILAVVQGKSGVVNNIREQYLGNISGITTCTQFGISTVILAGLLRVRPRRHTFVFWIAPLASLTVLRVLLNSERLAMIELIVPALVIAVHIINRTSSRRSVHSFLRVLPVAGCGALFVVFSAFEYFRSWLAFYSKGDQSFWEFAASRLLGYYVTAMNNSACMMRYLPHSFQVPLYTMGFFWQMPVLKDLTQTLLPQNFSTADYYGLLSRVANPEFNNVGGLFLPMFDLGVYAGLFYWFLSGLVCGILYRLFTRGNAWGLCLYPFVYITLLEIPRGIHWSTPRAFPAFCFLVMSAALLRIQQKRAEAAAVVADAAIPILSFQFLVHEPAELTTRQRARPELAL